jgi:hypothetical protein
MIDKFINWTNYWLVPEGSTDVQRNERINEVGFIVGMGVGLFLGFIVIMGIKVFC